MEMLWFRCPCHGHTVKWTAHTASGTCTVAEWQPSVAQFQSAVTADMEVTRSQKPQRIICLSSIQPADDSDIREQAQDQESQPKHSIVNK